MNRGFSLIELLVACALLMIIASAVAALAAPLRSALDRSDAGAQLETTARAALEPLVADVRASGSDAAVGDGQFRLAAVVPRVWPTPDLGTDVFATPGGAVRVTRIDGGAQAVLAAPAAVGAAAVTIETASRCSGGPPACGFAPGTAVVIYTDLGAEHANVQAIGAGVLVLDRALALPFPAGAVVASPVTATYGTRPAGGDSRTLVRITGGGAEQPMLDNVVEFEVAADSGDPWRIGGLSVRIRLQAPGAWMRGPVGYLFRRAGTAADARRWMPDVELRLTIAARNPPGAL